MASARPFRGISRRHLIRRVQRSQKSYQRRHFCWIEIPPVRGHVAAALDRLPYKLVGRHSGRDPIQRRASPATGAADRVAVATLLHLKDQRTLTFERRTAFEELHRHRIPAPSVHHWTPRRVI